MLSLIFRRLITVFGTNVHCNQRPNRTGFYRFEFGSVRLRFLESSSGSVRFDCISKRSVRVRFGSTAFPKDMFGFGSVRLHFQKICSGSVRFECISKTSVRIRFGSTQLRFSAFITE